VVLHARAFCSTTGGISPSRNGFSSAIDVQTVQPALHSGPNMKW
jgi:hypothetical protein